MIKERTGEYAISISHTPRSKNHLRYIELIGIINGEGVHELDSGTVIDVKKIVRPNIPGSLWDVKIIPAQESSLPYVQRLQQGVRLDPERGRAKLTHTKELRVEPIPYS